MPNGTNVIEEKKLKDINQKFCEEKLEVLIDRMKEGKRGWDNKEYYDYMLEELKLKILKVLNGEHTPKDFIHISNYAMFLWGLKSEEN